MSIVRTETTQPIDLKKGAQKLLQDARIDAAHSLNGQDSEPAAATRADSTNDSAENAPVISAIGSSNSDAAGEQLQRQAEQLAEYLRGRQRELDHREAQLNAEIAQLESDLRNTRLCLTERETELDGRRRDLDVREKKLLERLERLAAADAALKRQTVGEEQIHRDTSTLRQPRKELEKVETRLEQARADTQKFHEQLTAERRELRKEIRQERRRLIDQQRQALAELEKKRQTVERRGEHVDQCRAALMRLRAELQQTHREALEIRLTAEELWIKLSGAAPPAALTKSLGRIRNRLADQYRLANAELLERRRELETVRGQLAEQYEKLAEQKRQFERWAECRQEELQRQASMLIGREQTLLRQQTRFEEQAEQWQAERLRYEQEISRLHLKIAGLSEQTASV